MELYTRLSIERILNNDLDLSKRISKGKGDNLLKDIKTLSERSKISEQFIELNIEQIKRMAFSVY